MRFSSFIFAFLSLAVVDITHAQNISRAEFALYDMREDAESRKRETKHQYIDFAPAVVAADEDRVVMEQSFEMPFKWNDANVYIHIENVGLAYDLMVNHKLVDSEEDALTPSDFDISKFVQQGENRVAVIARSSVCGELQEGVELPTRPKFENSYIYSQNRRKIQDFIVRIAPDDKGEHARLYIDMIVENSFNFAEELEVGFDIYDPKGKLVEYSTRRVTIEGNSRDTVSFSPYIYGAPKWLASSSVPSLYKVMLYTKSNRIVQNYIPLTMGYGDWSYSSQDGAIYSFGKPQILKTKSYNAVSTKAEADKDLKALKKQGYNTIKPDYPQPLWFYELCDKVGLYVIDQANINAPKANDDKRVGGTPSNDPKLVDEYLRRVKKMYYRTRNFNCVIAYSLGGDSGNGYNMYKAYEWLKSVESDRPILYIGAADEWNSDKLQY